MVERMKYIAAREVFGNYLYFQDNENDSPKWTSDITQAKRFDKKKDALTKSDTTGVYEEAMIIIETEQ